MKIDNEKTFCCYCGRWIVYPLILTQEHLVPKSKGGNNSPANKRPCCSSCNTWRASRSLPNFKILVETYLKKHWLKKGYNRHDLRAMIENIDYIIDYVNKYHMRLKKAKTKC